VLNGSYLVPANVFLCYVLAGAFHVTGAPAREARDPQDQAVRTRTA
jgi:hypothetical protein